MCSTALAADSRCVCVFVLVEVERRQRESVGESSSSLEERRDGESNGGRERERDALEVAMEVCLNRSVLLRSTMKVKLCEPHSIVPPASAGGKSARNTVVREEKGR